MITPAGLQHLIGAGDYEVIVGEVGSTLRSLRWRGQEVLWTRSDAVPRRVWEGATLVPWPNRIRDGRYRFEGRPYSVHINDAASNTAMHGLAHSVRWSLLLRTARSVTLSVTIAPQEGWPGTVRVDQTYTVSEGGLEVRMAAANVGNDAVPFGYGSHPYYAFDCIDEILLSMPFRREIDFDERMLPRAVVPLTQQHDFRSPRELGRVTFGGAFTDAPGEWEVRLTGPRHTVVVRGDEPLRWVQLHTLPHRRAIAVEPLTCAADAFNPGPTHADLIVLEPGQNVETCWRVALTEPATRRPARGILRVASSSSGTEESRDAAG